jgi:eukaryotic-like serine/threonine-protein kinase
MSGQNASLQERYEQLGTLGRGGAGSVYLVRDRETGDRMALKRLLRADEDSVLRLKREFRALAGVSHPNLVKLYELGQDETSAYFTMEYLDGQDLRRYLTLGTQHGVPVANDNGAILRVLGAFDQLATGVRALHAAGLLHRDLKPSNVMVASGRVVVLDFGIALDLGASAETITQDKLSSGTPAYMAPEQVQGVHLGEPNDWYAFGAMLYEALSGKLPIEGKLNALLQRKLTHDPVPIARLVPGLPPPVAALCMQLLRRAPDERPSGDEVVSVLRAHSGNVPTWSQDLSASLAPGGRQRTEAELSLFGREPELAALWGAFSATQAGGSAAVRVFGESGAGKSLLLHQFCDEVERTGFGAGALPPLVLRSRCYERETLPFKALDGAMDALVSHLSRESDIVVSHALPLHLLALTQLFPALKGLSVTRQLLARETLTAGMSQTRAQAEAGLSDLLTRLGRQRPVVLWIDDLQWGDLDSVGIVSSWLEPPHIRNLMLVFSYRSEEIATSPALRVLRQGTDIEQKIALQRLGDEHVRALCRQRFELARWPEQAQARVTERIVLEAHGSPFLASQLAALAIAQPSTGDEQLARLTLEELVRSRSQALSPGARSLLNVLSVAGRPISLALAVRTAHVLREARACIHELQGLSMIRTRDSTSDRLLEVYHDRLREVVSALLSPGERRELERGLFDALRELGSDDSDWLHALALALGERAAALSYGLLAAARASEQLAFERAAELYEQCVELSPDPSANGGELWRKLALAYSYAGHGGKAAKAYLQAAAQVGPEQALQFEREAASQLICTGRFEEGEALLMRVLERLGLRAPSSEAGLYAALIWERARLALRGTSFEPRARSEVAFLDYFRAELYGMLSIETTAYNPLRAALFQARCLRTALDYGDSESIGRALCAAATIDSIEASERAHLRAEERLARAEAIAKDVDSALLATNIAAARAVCAFLTGRIEESIELCARGEHLLRTASDDSEYNHRFTLMAIRIGSLCELGQFRRADAELQVYLREAAATANINAELHISNSQAWSDTNAGRAQAAVLRLDRQLEQLPRGFGMLHVLHMISVLRIGCATGEHAWAFDKTRAHWQTFQRSVVKRGDWFFRLSFEAYARLWLCRAAREKQTRDLARELAPLKKALQKSPYPTVPGELIRIDARIAQLQGDRPRARQLLAASIERFEAVGAGAEAARDRFALGVLQGDAALQSAALQYIADLGVAEPLAQLRAYYPELTEGDHDG